MKTLRNIVVFVACIYYLFRVSLIELRIMLVDWRQRRLVRVRSKLVKSRDTINPKYDEWLNE